MNWSDIEKVIADLESLVADSSLPDAAVIADVLKVAEVVVEILSSENVSTAGVGNVMAQLETAVKHFSAK